MSVYSPDIMVWRQMLNPLMGLNMSRVVMMLNQAEMGYYPDLMWLYRFIEKRDATLRGLRARRLGSLKKIDWSIKIKEGDDVDQGLATEQQAFLQEKYNRIDNLKDAIQHLGLAEFRGFAHLEKHYDEQGEVKHLETVPQWHWVRKFPSKDWLYNAKALQSTNGVPIELNDFVIREIDCPINEIAVICFMRKNLSQKDWDGFIETYGIPPIFIELPHGVGKTEEYQAIADRVISDGRGVVGNGAKVITVDAGSRGANPFRGHVDYQDEQIVMAGTGGLLTQLPQPTGMNSSQGDVQESTFFDIAKGEAMDISEILQKQIDKIELDREFEGKPVYAYFELAHEEIEESETGIITDAVQLKSIGFDVDKGQLEEKTGYKLTATPMPAPGDGMGGGAPAEDYSSAPEDMPNVPYFNSRVMINQRKLIKNRCRKAVEAIANIGKMGDEQAMRALEKLSVNIPELVSA